MGIKAEDGLDPEVVLCCSLQVDESSWAADSAEDQKGHAGPGCQGI